MLRNNNLKICRRLARRDFRSDKAKNLMLALSAALITALYCFVLLLSASVRGMGLFVPEYSFGSSSHILFNCLTPEQAELISVLPEVKSSVRIETLGFLSSPIIGSRTVRLAVFGPACATAVFSLPTSGRLPETASEIAMDGLTLDSLGIPREYGSRAVIQWTTQDGETRTAEFTLCGWWSDSAGYTEDFAWICGEGAQRLLPGPDRAGDSFVTLGVTLHQPRDLEKQAAGILSETGGPARSAADPAHGQTTPNRAAFTVNPAFSEITVMLANQSAFSYYMTLPLVMLCGFLMFSSILRIALEKDIPYYAGLKALGMTPRQLRRLFVRQAGMVCALGIPPGWLAGFCVHLAITPKLVFGMDQNPALYFLTWKPFFLSGLLTWFASLLAWAPFMLRIGEAAPARALEFTAVRSRRVRRAGLEGHPDRAVQPGRAGHPERAVQPGRVGLSDDPVRTYFTRPTTLPRLALQTLARGKRQTCLSLLSLLLAVLLLCESWIYYISFDEETYLSALSPWDYSVLDSSCYYTMIASQSRYTGPSGRSQPRIRYLKQRYNPGHRGVTDAMAEELRARPEVVRVSALKTRELELTASPALRKLTTDFYNRTEENGKRRRDLMSVHQGWISGLNRLENTGGYTGLVVGLDGAYLDYVTEQYPLVDGSFDRDAFDTGGYVLTAGAVSSELSALPAGEEITLAGRSFRVMASVQGDSSFISGSNSPDADFCLLYYLPLSAFNELFPDQSFRQLAVDIDPGRQDSFERYLFGRQQELKESIAVTMRSQLQEKFRRSRFNSVLITLIVGAVLLLIGLLSFINMLITKTVARKREFAVYESLGMTRTQLKKLLLLEGFLHAALLAAVLVPAAAAITWYVMPALLSQSGYWCIVYRYDPAPLWIFLPVILLAAATAQLGGLRLVTRGSLAERLKRPE